MLFHNKHIIGIEPSFKHSPRLVRMAKDFVNCERHGEQEKELNENRACHDFTQDQKNNRSLVSKQ
jgi:hypothetical protein